MNSRSSNFYRFSFALFDLFALNLVQAVLVVFVKTTQNFAQYLTLFAAGNIVWLISAYITALYIGKQNTFENFFKRTAQAFLIFFSVVLLFIFLYNFTYNQLFVLFIFAGFGTILLISRTILLGATYYLQKKQFTIRKVIVLGNNPLAKQLEEALLTNKTMLLEGYFEDTEDIDLESLIPKLGVINESINYAVNNDIEEIYCTISPEQNKHIYHLAQQAETNFIRFKFVPDFRMFVNRNIHIDFAKNIPILSLRQEPLQEFSEQIKKRVFDTIFSFLVITLLLSWLFPIIALIIKLDSKGPIFFTQLRSGKNNKPFLCIKFRSLKVNNEADKKQVTKEDGRFTRIGKFLRKTNLDELPQFFNVLSGEMSIVGPRPHMLKHTEEYSNLLNQYMIRHYVKPGVTGWAQINGYRGEIREHEQLEKRVEYDIWYMENWSMWFDLRIILLTVYRTFKGDENAF